MLMSLFVGTLIMVTLAFSWSSFVSGSYAKPDNRENARVFWMRPQAEDSRPSGMALIADYFDPSLMSLPSPRGFSRGAWSHLHPPTQTVFEPERTSSFLLPVSGMELPVLVAQADLGDVLQAGVERAHVEAGTGVEAPADIAPAKTNSIVHFVGDVAARAVLLMPALPLAPQGVPSRQTRIYLAVGVDGRVRHVTLDRSSGNEALDTEALEIVRKLRFESVSSADPMSLTWGGARFYWAVSP